MASAHGNKECCLHKYHLVQFEIPVHMILTRASNTSIRGKWEEKGDQDVENLYKE